jgi:hypothetical protein
LAGQTAMRGPRLANHCTNVGKSQEIQQPCLPC